MNTRCQICKRTLSATESVNNGIGPECAAKYANGIQAAGSSVARVNELAGQNDPQVNRWLYAAKRAIGKGRIAEAEGFSIQAEKASALPFPQNVAPRPLPESRPEAPALMIKVELNRKMEAAINRCKANRPKVRRVSSNIVSVVSRGGIYTVSLSTPRAGLTLAHCDCAAGRDGKLCYHIPAALCAPASMTTLAMAA